MDMVSVQGPVRWPQHPTPQEAIFRLLHLNILGFTSKDPIDKIKMQEVDVKNSVGDCVNREGTLFNAISKITSSTHPQHPHVCPSGLARITCSWWRGHRLSVNDPLTSTGFNTLWEASVVTAPRNQCLPQDLAYFSSHGSRAGLLPISSFVFLCVLILRVDGYSCPPRGLSQD